MGLLNQGSEMLLQIRERDGVGQFQDGLRVVFPHVREQHPKRREHAAMLRNNHCTDLKRVSDLTSMHAARPAEGQQRELTWIVATLYRDGANSTLHIGIGNLN